MIEIVFISFHLWLCFSGDTSSQSCHLNASVLQVRVKFYLVHWKIISVQYCSENRHTGKGNLHFVYYSIYTSISSSYIDKVYFWSVCVSLAFSPRPLFPLFFHVDWHDPGQSSTKLIFVGWWQFLWLPSRTCIWWLCPPSAHVFLQ